MGKFKLRVTELAKEKGITTLHKHLTDRGVSSYIATEIRQGRLERFDLALLWRLCVIFKCPLEELIVFEPGNDQELLHWPFFRGMVKTDKPIDMQAKLDSLDSDKMKLLEEFLKRM